MDLNYFKAIQGAFGADSAQEVLIRQAKDNLSVGMSTSIANARLKRNGNEQDFVISETTVRYKYQITAYPDEELYVGDVIDYMDEKWIVTETRVGNPLQKTGVMWLCNINLSFQNGTHDIITRPAVLDSGVFWGNELTHITIPAVGVYEYAFYDNPLTSVVLMEGIPSIGLEAFLASDLTEIEIPGNLNYIDNFAFENNKNLTKIVVRGKTSAPSGFAEYWNCKTSDYDDDDNPICVEYYDVEFRP